ncbi:hyoscyamine 6-dioxygenase-like [Prosopis cineraria]|uniref:hyoscyamine 6-dioxygenase-like n=1 Tax=Prosopis cineraria TaxID=364024 RepID=UPI00240EFD4F|nr:hyoscyamine 6-dioxygenase-like [Prosopis cineraria]
MENLVSNWYNWRSVPDDYIFPPETRPGNPHVPLAESISVIDLSQPDKGDPTLTIQKIIKAAQEFGFFLVHAVHISYIYIYILVFFRFGERTRKFTMTCVMIENIGDQSWDSGQYDLIDETMSVWKEFFQLPADAKQHLYTEGFTAKDCWLATSTLNYVTEKVHLWKVALRHSFHPLEKWQYRWPQTPARYQECVGACSVEVKKLGSRILRLISEGLGLHAEYLEGEYSQATILSANHMQHILNQN